MYYYIILYLIQSDKNKAKYQSNNFIFEIKVIILTMHSLQV